ncbi:MAG: ERF family protein [Oscillospiraceae bacterium]|nr:ERF family protein [Candidatus Limimonas egerieequi]
MAEQLNIYQKMAKIRKSVEVLEKNKSGYGYKYVTDDAILEKITGLMDKHHVSLIPNVVPGTLESEQINWQKTKGEKLENINEVLVKGDMEYAWINDDDPEERIVVPWIFIGQQSDASQAFGSGLTYSMRYFLLKYFNIATPDDDPDSWRSRQKEAVAAEDKALSEGIIKQLDGMVRSYLAKNSDDSEEVKKFFGKYVKGGDYNKITDPTMATKVLTDFTDKFLSKE